MRASSLFTSESVSEGHPDKVSDQISDAILDAFLEKDVKLGIADDSAVNTRLGCETLCTTNKIVIAGEGRGQLFRDIHGVSVVDRELISEIARGVVKDIGYDQNGFSYHGADIEVLLHGQSPDIAMGVDAKKKRSGEEEGAGDQGMMFGYACNESEIYEKGSFMPAPIFFAHRILKVLSEKRRNGQMFDLQPDAKSEVTVKYVDGKAVGCTKVVVSTQHNEKSRNGKKYSPNLIKEMISSAVEIISLIRPGEYFLLLRLFSLCCVETTTLVQPTALPSTYFTVTWLLASGCRSNSWPLRRFSDSTFRILCAKKIGAGM